MHPKAGPARSDPLSGHDTARLVEDAAGLEKLLTDLDGVEEYAIDTEFQRERTYFSRLALVQVAWAEQVALVDPLAVDPGGLRPLLESPALAVLHAAGQDLEVLEQTCGAVPGTIFDTQVSAGFLGYASVSLLTLAESILGVQLHKVGQLTDWTRRPLSASQRVYAAGDVAHLLELRWALDERLQGVGRAAWAAEECSVLLGKDRSPTRPELAWWKLPHSRQLRGASRGVAQEVAAWRESRAQKLDLPVRFVLSDLALLSIAQRSPTSRAELSASRGIDGRHLSGGAGEEILAAVKRGRALSSSALNLPPAVAQERSNKPVVTLASAYVAQCAADMHLDPAVLATRGDLLSFFQEPSAGRLTSGWRAELLEDVLKRLAGGTAALAFDGAGRLVLEERSGRPVVGV
ncbi:MAG: ribonuclease D [Acidimicrobiales bacterium]